MSTLVTFQHQYLLSQPVEIPNQLRVQALRQGSVLQYFLGTFDHNLYGYILNPNYTVGECF
jgi:hypothetical protein